MFKNVSRNEHVIARTLHTFDPKITATATVLIVGAVIRVIAFKVDTYDADCATSIRDRENASAGGADHIYHWWRTANHSRLPFFGATDVHRKRYDIIEHF